MHIKLLQVRIDKDLLDDFKIILIKENKKIKQVIEEFIKSYVNARKNLIKKD